MPEAIELVEKGVRDYEAASAADAREFYRLQRQNCTLAIVNAAVRRYAQPWRLVSTWGAIVVAGRVRDGSDPDMLEAQAAHFDGTMRGVAAEDPAEIAIVAAGLHDVGKLTCAGGLTPEQNDSDEVLEMFEAMRQRPDMYNEPQWLVVGDSYPAACRFQPQNILYDMAYHDQCPDAQIPHFTTENGIYEPGAGFGQLVMNSIHDAYIADRFRALSIMYDWVRRFGVDQETIDRWEYILRYHSFFGTHDPKHDANPGYAHFMGSVEKKRRPALQWFRRMDAYTKPKSTVPTEAELAERYRPTFEKWAPQFLL